MLAEKNTIVESVNPQLNFFIYFIHIYIYIFVFLYFMILPQSTKMANPVQLDCFA